MPVTLLFCGRSSHSGLQALFFCHVQDALDCLQLLNEIYQVISAALEGNAPVSSS